MDSVKLRISISTLYNKYPYLIPVLVSAIITYKIGFARVFPLWSDPGEWLKYAKAYEAVILGSLGFQPQYAKDILDTMGSQIVFGYPPLTLFLITVFRAVLGDVPGVQYLGTTLLIIQPIPIYLITYRLTKLRWLSILAGLYASFTPGYMEIFGWGGYPNLLGFFLIGMSIYYLLGLLMDDEGILKPLATSILIVFTHHLSTAVYISILFLWGVLIIVILKRSDQGLKIIGLSAVTGLILALYRYGLGYLEDYITYNEAAYYELRVDYIKMILWIFKEPIVFVIGLFILVYALHVMYKYDVKIFTLFTAWTSIPIILTFGYLFGLALDYNRFILFLTQPIPILLSLSFLSLRKTYLWEIFIHWRRKLGSLLLLLLLLGYTSLYLVNGAVAPYKIDEWYNQKDRYGWWGRHDALTWIRDNTVSTAKFAADELMGRWIEGYSHRKAFINTDPKWLFRSGQIEEYFISSSMYGGLYEYRSPAYRVFIQGDVNPRYSIDIRYWRYGDYEPAFYIPIPDVVELHDPYRPSAPLNVSKAELIYIEEGGFQAIYWTNKSLIIIQTLKIVDTDTLKLRFEVVNKTAKYTAIPIKIDKNIFISFTIEENVIKLKYDEGYIYLVTDGFYDAYLLPWEDDKLLIVFSDNVIDIVVEFKTRRNQDVNGVLFSSIWDIAEEYGINYIVISTKDYRETNSPYYFLGRIFKVAYNNGFVTILKIMD